MAMRDKTATSHAGRWRRKRWLLARRAAQLLVLTAFLLGPWAGLWVVRTSTPKRRTAKRPF